MRAQNQLILPIIIEKIEIMKNILPSCLQTLNTVPLSAIHNDGVVGFKNVIKNPVKNPFEAGLTAYLFNSKADFLELKDILVDISKTIPDIIQNKLRDLGFLEKIVRRPRFIIIIYTISADTAPSETLNPALNPFVSERLTDSRPEGPKGIDAKKPVEKPINIALNIALSIDIVNTENIVFSFKCICILL
ncbi:hypothetical protein psyc5s11_55280 [Clostridium gelidum]|uniref:Uncharacterized protein n=1 Tax=Clostridium gelidum TaxID=704125 RepID=A0ABN6J571_9CLOT|nr:hypothetical protein psyc5s11_55280 [Clostridium gelidum]